MAATIWGVLLASLVGSIHCAGMCGPLVALAVGVDRVTWRRRIGLQVWYHGGRAISYTTFGAIAGLIGQGLDLSGRAVGVSGLAPVLAGVTVGVVGVVSVLRVLGVSVSSFKPPAALRRAYGWGHRVAVSFPPTVRAGVIGLVTVFLPCGWLYAFVVVAAGTSSPLMGALVMLAFWIGTVPVLAAVGTGVAALFGGRGKGFQLAMIGLVLGAATMMLLGRIRVPVHGKAPDAVGRATQTDQQE